MIVCLSFSLPHLREWQYKKAAFSFMTNTSFLSHGFLPCPQHNDLQSFRGVGKQGASGAFGKNYSLDTCIKKTQALIQLFAILEFSKVLNQPNVKYISHEINSCIWGQISIVIHRVK